MGRVHGAETTQRSTDGVIARLAEAQYGVFSREQAKRFGATKGMMQRRVATGRWDQVSADVFRLTGTVPLWRQSLMAACLAWGEGAAISYRAAAALWRLLGFDVEIVELSVPRGRRRNAPGVIHRDTLLPGDVSFVGPIPATTVTRTFIDLASTTPKNRLQEALDDALRKEIITISRLRRRVAAMESERRGGVVLLREILDERDPTAAVPQSVFETRLLRCLRDAGLPHPRTQYEIYADRGLVAILDFAYPDVRLAIEADGYAHHSSRQAWEHDRRRRNALTLLGWRVVHVTWRELVQRPDSVSEAIAKALIDS